MPNAEIKDYYNNIRLGHIKIPAQEKLKPMPSEDEFNRLLDKLGDEDYFDVIEKSEYDSILKYICPPGVRQAYNENETSKALFETLILLDELLIKEDVLSPVAGTFLLKAK